jgi:hypothetical protein
VALAALDRLEDELAAYHAYHAYHAGNTAETAYLIRR